ncbi:putative nucleotidyltransferase with HDIG domain [Peteryoungia aggregata LMG 23059]|uniref:Nucleotidyltransferase with HDIG domain n=1 Tax=Peteryoungia aggregata LMG 23059 TaxID=1368425 RepID=A0ABU0GEH1_9HYPH|nr:HD domain-containing phosphohydrolase [Peteryoungia aggregata]MDQ0423339.1 putative nucleotidyltransferase with HDIG domain [Peteryoungia aggregata LMG 23059]
MLVKIQKQRIRKGMFIESVACPSREFARRRFILASDKDLAAILATSATEVSINIALGLDENGAQSRAGSQAAPHAEPQRAQAVRGEIDQAAITLRANLREIVGAGTLDMAGLSRAADDNARTWSDSAVIALEVTRLKTKDETTYVHSLAVSGMMTLLARALELDDETTGLLGVAGMLHDIGKLLIPNEILTKPGALTDAEREIIRNHPEAGYQLLKTYPEIPQVALDICRLHHEVLDGSGYPLGLKQKDLSATVRLSTVCDVFEALTSVRPYKRPWTSTEALDWMFARPHLFDRKMVIRLGSVLVDAPIV